MSDRQLNPAELDALVLRELSSLPGLAPSRGFQDRVMARVIMPKPAALVVLRRAGAWVTQPRRAFVLASAYALCVLVAVSLGGPWVAAHVGSVGQAAEWLSGHLWGWVDGGVTALAGWAMRSGLVESLRTLAGSGPRLWAEVATVTIAYAAGGYGLHALLKAPERSEADVARSR